MTIEIRELVIKTTVTNGEPKEFNQAQILKILEQHKKQILRECRMQIISQLAEERMLDMHMLGETSSTHLGQSIAV